MKHVMLDIETLGTKPGCAILSIGAVAFDREGLGNNYYSKITNPMGEISYDTVAWWMKQAEAAKKSAFEGLGKTHGQAIADFYQWFIKEQAIYLWCHGATFDEPLIRYAANIQIEPPWKFYNVRCTRTLYEVSGLGPDRNKGLQHNALDDAISQAEAVIASFTKLGWPT